MAGDTLLARLALGGWGALGTALAPVAPLYLRRRARRGKEDAARLGERFGGAAGGARQGSPLVWVHAASVGETNTVLPLVERLSASGLAVLLTTGTVTAARVAAARLPPGAVHRFAPLDMPGAVARFLDGWRPALAVFAETEFWPTTMEALRRRGIPLVVVNARLAPRSFSRWRRVPALGRAIAHRIALALAQSEEHAARLRELGVGDVRAVGNLKYDVPAPGADGVALVTARARLAGRPVLLGASLHPGEFAAFIAAARVVATAHAEAMVIAAPRHPDRGAELAAVAAEAGFSVALRSRAGSDPWDAGFLVADTIGEMGLWYRLADVAFVGGSLVPHGGQNPIEPAKLGPAIVHGPHVGNFVDDYRDLDAGGGATLVSTPSELAPALLRLLGDKDARRRSAEAASRVVAGKSGALERTLSALAPLIAEARSR